MKFLQTILLLCLHKFSSNYISPKNFLAKSSDLPIQNRFEIIKVCNVKFNGTDDRYPLIENMNGEEMDKIIKNYNNKCKLNILENESISIYHKLELLRDSSIKPYHLEGGGLMKDYNFEL